MIADTFRDHLIRRLGGRTDLISLVFDLMNEVKNTVLERRAWYPWFLIQDTAEDSTHLQTVVGSELVALPTGYLMQVEDEDVYLLNSDGEVERILAKMYYADMLNKFDVDDEIYAYTLRGMTMRVRGLPTEVRNIRMKYYKADANFATGQENNWLKYASAAVFGEVGALMAGHYIKDYDMAARFEQDAAKAWLAIQNETTSRLEAGADRIKGD